MLDNMRKLLSRLPVTEFLWQATRHRNVIYAMAVRDFRSRFVGTLGGTIWAIVQPLSIVTVFYFVFAVGLRVQGPDNVPFILWFVAGLAPWFFFNETLTAITNSVTGNSHLIKKTKFPSEVLPIMQVISGTIPHIIFMLILLLLLIYFGFVFEFARVILVYFFACMVFLICGLGWMFSALQVFYKDIGQALSVILNILFWSTPIVWPENIVPEKFQWILSYNPIYYIVSGYRDALIYDVVVWPNPFQTIYFWSFTLTAILIGSHVFGRLKHDFADVI